MNITKCKGEGQGSCTRCNARGKWNRMWMCFLNKIEGLEGIYCNDCTKEIMTSGAIPSNEKPISLRECMEKHNEFHTNISQNGTQFRLTFITNDKNNFLAMQDLARKCVDSTTPISMVKEANDGKV